MAIYWGALNDLDDATFVETVQASIRRHRFFPKVAELLDLAEPPSPPRDPEDDFDLISVQQRHDADHPPIVLLPEVAVSPEQQAERARRYAELRAEVVAQMRAACMRHGGGWRPARPRTQADNAEARAWLLANRARRTGGA